jgi:hypothetical protein
MPFGHWRASGARVAAPGGRVAQASGRSARPLRVPPRPRRAGQAGVDRRPHAATCCVNELGEGRKDASLMVTECSEESEIGKANHTAKEHRGRTTAGDGGERPGVLKRWSVPTGEPDNTARGPSGSGGGWGKRSVSNLARSLPNLVPRARLRQQLRRSVRPLRVVQQWESSMNLRTRVVLQGILYLSD